MSADIIALTASLILAIPLYLWMSLAAVAVFRKAGVETWPAWIPVYNVWVLCSLAGITPWLALLCLIPPFIPIVFLVVGIQLSPRFGLSPAWGVLAAVCAPAYLTVLGWGNAHWDGPQPERPAPTAGGTSPRPDLDWLSNPQHTQWNGVSDATEIAAPLAPRLGESVSDTVRADVPAASWAPPTPPAMPGPVPGTPVAGAPAAATPSYPPAPPLSVSLPAPIEAEQTPDWRNLFASSAEVPGASDPSPEPASQVPASLTEAPYVPEPAAPAADPYGAASSAPGLAPTFFEYRDAPPSAGTPLAPVAPVAPEAVADAPDAPVTPEAGADAPVAPAVTPAPEELAPPVAEPPILPPSPAAAPWAPPAAVNVAPPAVSDAGPAGSPSFGPPVLPAETPAAAEPPAAPENSASAAGATRMREDSEVVADARASAVPLPGLTPPVDRPAVDPDESYRPIVIPGPPANPVADSAFAPMRRSEAPSELSESVLDYSQEVSAVVGAPDAGAPRAARESVSAQAREFVSALDDDDFEATELASRRRPVWTLTPPLGGDIALTSEAIVLGRRPAESDERVQNVPVADGTRTVSKTHARLDLIDGVWWITDLASTNGVFLIDESGAEQELRPGIPAVLTERFLLGDAELRISRATA
ncbi:DUF5684 domain-containing protein [Microbacterium gorillae]|uniref:DUF5684 domain-containing protein n=1 Tax=Microbacterium gorillae TaxID=1231063 RepID=UPI003D991E79